MHPGCHHTFRPPVLFPCSTLFTTFRMLGKDLPLHCFSESSLARRHGRRSIMTMAFYRVVQRGEW
jgi:hypothetical protein